MSGGRSRSFSENSAHAGPLACVPARSGLGLSQAGLNDVVFTPLAQCGFDGALEMKARYSSWRLVGRGEPSCAADGLVLSTRVKIPFEHASTIRTVLSENWRVNCCVPSTTACNTCGSFRRCVSNFESRCRACMMILRRRFVGIFDFFALTAISVFCTCHCVCLKYCTRTFYRETALMAPAGMYCPRKNPSASRQASRVNRKPSLWPPAISKNAFGPRAAANSRSP
jgi:hypothetical protein